MARQPIKSSFPVTFTVPFVDWLRILGIGHNRGYDLLRAGEVDSVMAGDRRLIILQSSEDYLDRLRRGVERDPKDKAAAVAAFKRSLKGPGAAMAAQAREARRRKRALSAGSSGE